MTSAVWSGNNPSRSSATEALDYSIPPSQLFRDHIFGCFLRDATGMRVLDLIGEDNVMCESDYPHADTTWPDSVTIARDCMRHLPATTQHKLLRGNAERLYRFTPAAAPVAQV